MLRECLVSRRLAASRVGGRAGIRLIQQNPDIPDILLYLGLITEDQSLGLLTGADGTKYVVEAVWSKQGGTIAAFAPVPSP